MEPNAKAVALIARFEGLVLKAYPDPASGGDPWTIGYGATGPDIKPGVVWTREQAVEDLSKRVNLLVEEVKGLIKRPIPNDAIASIVSLAYNIGITALSKSTLLRKVNEGKLLVAADEFNKWVRAAGKIYPGLVKRRAQERQVFLDAIKT